MNRGELNFTQPWIIPNIVAVTGSHIRREALTRYGIPFEVEELFLTPSGQAELFHQNGNESLIVDYNRQGFPYSLRMARVKNQAIRSAIDEVHGTLNWPPHGTVDSTFVVSRGRKRFALNKPGSDESRVEALIRFYDRLRGARISSNSGIEVVSTNGASSYHFEVSLGIINPKFDLSILENLIRNHPNYSGGMTTHVALENEIIILAPERPYPHLTVEQIGERRPFLFGRIVLGSNKARLDYSTNLFFDAAIGVLPKDFRLG